MANVPNHPGQDAARRREVSKGQSPHAVIFGCSDSRVAAEIIFDQGLGDTFVVRTAGHVLDTTVIGSIEYGIQVLHVPLVVVLGHDQCGAVAAALHALRTGEQPAGFLRAVVDRVIPSILTVAGHGDHMPDPVVLRREHVRRTVEMVHAYSATLGASIAAGAAAIVGVDYALAEGMAHLIDVVGDVGEEPIPAG